MAQTPLWRTLLLIAVVLLGALYALPNLFGDSPAIQISPRRAAQIDAALQGSVEQALIIAGVEDRGIELGSDRMLVKFASDADRRAAIAEIEPALAGNYTAAATRTPNTPGWLRALGAKPMYMGLDLRGGVHFLMQVDMDEVVKQAFERYVSDLRGELRAENIRYRSVVARDGELRLVYLNPEVRAEGDALIRENFRDLVPVERDTAAAEERFYALAPEVIDEAKENALRQNLTTLRKRINEFGVAEPVIQRQGLDRIVVQLPGIEDPAKAKEILGATATLEFRMVDTDNSVSDAVAGSVPTGAELFYDREGQPVLLEKRVMLTGEYIIGAASGIDSRSGQPKVDITLDGKGARRFGQATRDEVGKPLAVLYIEQQKGRPIAEVINIATIREQLNKRFQITGLDSTDEARTLALLLRAGSLAAPVEIVEERTVGPSLGQENIDRGFNSVKVGFVLVLLFMAIYYRTFGLIADLALALNVILIVGALSLLQATLTLPGIAGIVLTVGMAVDANVLIFERIKEELRAGISPLKSIESGYERAFLTITDANVTTLIAAVVLLSFGTGPIKGFAVTLSIGIVTSMFTAILGTRVVVNALYGGRRRVQKLAI
jgi:preprotein translocase subunit SecD